MKILVSEIRSQKLLHKNENLDPSLIIWSPPENFEFKNPVNISLKAQLVNSDAVVTGKVDTLVNMNCGRCLKPFKQKIENNVQVVYPLSDQYIDLTNDFREAILIELPANPLCQENCLGMCPYCGINKNDEKCECEMKTISPNLKKLKNINL